jgi:2-keto-4-pentenoate hydratase
VTAFHAELADQLLRAERDRIPVPPLTSHSALDVADAYQVQAINIGRRRADGDRIAGRKVGLTSLAMQRQLGVDEPDFGFILDSMLIADGGALDVAELIDPRVEAEIAFRLGADIGGDVTDNEARAAIAEVFLSLEVIDSRIANWKITLPDTIADNASSARMVAAPPTSVALSELPKVEVTLTEDGRESASGVGAAVLGDPIRAVVWLARMLAGFGETLHAGELILAGAVHASVPLRSGVVVAATAPGFAPVRLLTRGS